MTQVPKEFIGSRAITYIVNKGLEYKQTDSRQIELDKCPFCNKTGFGHLYIVADCSNQDGLFKCHRCGVSGNLFDLKKAFGDAVANVVSMEDYSRSNDRERESLPDIEALHEALLGDGDAMDYLENFRGFSREAIQKAKIGLTTRGFKGLGQVRALVYPYFVNDNCVFVHYRSLPSNNNNVKAFNSPKGWDAPLYNSDAIKEGIKELIMVEGEPNTIAALDKGVENVVGVPGANFKKAMWLDQIDKVNPEKIYICYDKDSVGQKAAQNLASRIGIQKCYKIVLPDFKVTSYSGEEKQGKDINEWFSQGAGTKDTFEKLKEEAKLFDVQGVSSTTDALSELEDMLNNKNSILPKYMTPWPFLNKLIGFNEADVIDIVGCEKQGKTTFGLNLMEHVVDTYKEDGLIICLEMPTIRLVRKWVSLVTNTPDTLVAEGEEASKALESMKTAIKTARKKSGDREGTLYFCYPPQMRAVEDMYKLIHDCVRRYGVKWIMVDNLQLLCDKTLKNQNHRTIHLSQISKELAGIAKDYNIQMIRILQPHRIRDGQMVTTDDVDGASQVAKDCDCMLTIHRPRSGEQSKETLENAIKDGGHIEESMSFSPDLFVTVGLSRYTSGGYTNLYYDGPCSAVRNSQIEAMKAAVNLVETKEEAITI